MDQFPEPRDYIGDGVYVAHDGFALILRANDPEDDSKQIVLEPEVYRALVRFADRCGIEGPRHVKATPGGE